MTWTNSCDWPVIWDNLSLLTSLSVVVTFNKSLEMWSLCKSLLWTVLSCNLFLTMRSHTHTHTCCSPGLLRGSSVGLANFCWSEFDLFSPSRPSQLNGSHRPLGGGGGGVSCNFFFPQSVQHRHDSISFWWRYRWSSGRLGSSSCAVTPLLLVQTSQPQWWLLVIAAIVAERGKSSGTPFYSPHRLPPSS